jgi:hypothetical protein
VRTIVVQREWRRVTYVRYTFRQRLCQIQDANIIIFRKQVKIINSLYSCGYEGTDSPVWSHPGNLGETQTYPPNLGGWEARGK